MELLETSAITGAITGEYGASSALSTNSRTGSCDPSPEEDGPTDDSEECEQLDFEERFMDVMRCLVKSTDRLVEQNDEFIAIQRKAIQLKKMQLNRQTIPQELLDLLKSYGLNLQQRIKMMHALNNPVKWQSFMDATAEEQNEVIGEYIPGFYQPYYRGVHPNPAANASHFFFSNFNGQQPPN